MMNKKLTDQIIEKINNISNEDLIQNFNFQNQEKNELLFFFKPECFLHDDKEFVKKIVQMVLQKFNEYDAKISGMYKLKGNRLEDFEIMDKHYGYINTLSKNASKILTKVEKDKIQELLAINNLNEYQIIGGHEFLNSNKEFDETSLEELWLTKKSLKLRSGFYFQSYTISQKKYILINGFHPKQLRHFTTPSHMIIIILLHSNTNWKVLKNDLVGNTFPEKAEAGSIRGELYSNNSEYGLQNVTIANNCVHLSAGPFEALFEINNFLKNLQGVNFNIESTNMYKLMKNRQIQGIDDCLKNPEAYIEDKKNDLFSFTEDKNSGEAINDYLKYFMN